MHRTQLFDPTPGDSRPIVIARPHTEGFEVAITWPGSATRPEPLRVVSLAAFWEVLNDLTAIHTETRTDPNQYELFTDEEGTKS
ncbi:hypothetical protein E1181_11645 [Saccharopolyspora terrae]|uniref:Uncharacterized protein n=1 Tax=Saccharopolyspora terrae TaxID=2530384 RepID=A0A4R4VTN8_9PSEU|nr:hypothetical protein [Saccharopolyspora terrae]TDD06653.1 hypothetical protein E1181_11645 [Saccharopolyspora terrae]